MRKLLFAMGCLFTAAALVFCFRAVCNGFDNFDTRMGIGFYLIGWAVVLGGHSYLNRLDREKIERVRAERTQQ